MNTPIASSESLQIGSVDFVSPDEIKVLLDLDAPSDVALNSGVPRPFPRINSYVLIAGEGGYLVCQIEWITIERSQFPKRRGMQDFWDFGFALSFAKDECNSPWGLERKYR